MIGNNIEENYVNVDNKKKDDNNDSMIILKKYRFTQKYTNKH
jgi:hypothetical protein